MTTGALIISSFVLVLGVVWLALPFLRRGATLRAQEVTRQKEREALLTTYERILTTLRDLDEDYSLGKLPPEGYQVERERWAAQGAAVLEALEHAGGRKPTYAQPAHKATVSTQADAEALLDDAIEKAIANYVQAQNGAGG